ncbi:protein-L-isoaspartate(D-aspartate) O-methyltransferase [Streptomyces sp. KR80]|uniref:protein-L-isoaspartate(D-aspartate) O-methyltransferase n=1 Tax=Streptomyces sp. KR80 TaxID=3457426 RepID=UPI003FD69B50
MTWTEVQVMRDHPGGSSPEDLVWAARAAGVTDDRVAEAIRRTPRADFVPRARLASAYTDVPIPIAHGQVTTQPSLIAMMINALELTGTERVLEVGTGYGFQTALLAHLTAYVVSIERWPDMVEEARRGLAKHGLENVEIVVGDGTHGVPARAPYDAVVVSAAFPEVPPPLVEQLRVGGRIVQPIGPGGQEQVELYERRVHGLVHRRSVVSARFVRLFGDHGYPPTDEATDT